MKKTIVLFATILLCLCGCSKSLPKPDGGGELNIDKNINVENIDEYLGRDDAVYRDMRMLVDEAQYENVGGDSVLSGFVEGFEVIPYPYLVNFLDGQLPPEVGAPYSGKTLFTKTEKGEISPNYEESMDILEYYFPKDKVIFLMCGGGGYAGMTKDLLVALGWDETKIYNVGGFWSYKGQHTIDVKNSKHEGEYDFWKIQYHDINFDSLHEIEE